MSIFNMTKLRWGPIRYAVLALTILIVTTAAASLAPDRKPAVDKAMRISELEGKLGSLPASTLDAREGLEPLPLTTGEQDKFARARAAVDAAEAAGTRWIEPAPGITRVATEADAARKLERFWNQEPNEHSWTPGVPANEQGGGR